MCYSRDWQREAKAREAQNRRSKVIDDLRVKAEKQTEAEKRAETAKKDAREIAPAK